MITCSERCWDALTGGYRGPEWLNLHDEPDRAPEQAGMRLRKRPVRPAWKPMYASPSVRIESWSRFISEAYWNVKLER